MADPRFIAHVTLTTGHVRRSPRDEVGELGIDAANRLLSSALAGERADLSQVAPGLTPAGCTLWADPRPSRCPVLVVYGPQGDPIATIGIGAHSRCGAPLWRRLHEGGTSVLATDPERCPPEPWCAVRLEYGLLAHPEAAHWLGDLERCIAWAWIDRQ